MRQQLDLETLKIKKGEKSSDSVKLHQWTVVLTIYAPKIDGAFIAFVEASYDNKQFYPLIHKGVPVKMLQASSAYNVPIPACKALRVTMLNPVDEDVEFRVLQLMDA